MAYSCENCGAFAEDSSKLCKPTTEDQNNKFCGVPAAVVCNSKFAEMRYTCDACGSVSADAGKLCSPSQLR